MRARLVALVLLLLPTSATAQFGFPPVNPTQFQIAGVPQTPLARVNFSTGLSGSLSGGTLTITNSGVFSGVTADSPLTGAGTSASHLTCTTCAVTGGFTMTGDITLANSATAITSGAYALNLKAGSATGGIVLTAVSGDTASNNFVTISNAFLVGNPGVTGLAVQSGSTSLNTRVAMGIDNGTWIGYHCSVGEDIVVDTGGVTAKKIVVWSGANKVQDAAKTVNLTTIAGVAVNTVGSGGIAKICKSGYALLSITDAGCTTAGQSVSTDGTGTAGFGQCTVAPVFGAGIGKITAVPAANVAVVDVHVQ